MHFQIKKVIQALRPYRDDGRVVIELTAQQSTPLGDIVADIFYRTGLLDMLNRGDYTGYPHNGGQHTLTLMIKPLDGIAFIDEVQESLKGMRDDDGDYARVLSELAFVSQELHSFRKAKK